MGEWKECELEKIAEVQTGPFGSQLKNEQYITGGTPVVTVEHINNFRIIDFNYPSVTDDDKQRLSKYLLKAGDIIFTRVGSVDLSAYVKPYQDGWMFSSRMLRIRPTQEIDSRFLSYFFQQNRFREYILNISVGATMPSINTEILKGIPVSYPPLPEQKAIASVLSSLDDKIDLLQRQNKTLEAMAETLFRQWFVEEAQDDWEDGCLEDIATFSNGKSRPEVIVNGSIPVYGGNGILGFTNSSNYEGITIIIGRVGAYCGSLFIEDKAIWITDNALSAKPINEKYIYYLFYLLKSLNINEMAEGSSHPLLTQTLLKSIDIIMPPEQQIFLFNSFIENWMKKIKFNLTQIRTLEKLRDTLLPKLMSGVVRVRV
jgi:type I restriction enzyme S subunit